MIFVHAFFFILVIFVLLGLFVCLFVLKLWAENWVGIEAGRIWEELEEGKNMIKIKYTQKICQIFFKRKKSVYD